MFKIIKVTVFIIIIINSVKISLNSKFNGYICKLSL
jgi:hypothetical protein